MLWSRTFPLHNVFFWNTFTSTIPRGALPNLEQAMAISYRIDTQHAMIFAVATGTITDSDIQKYFEAILQDGNFSPTFRHLVDCSKVISLQISAAMVGVIARRKVFSPRAKRAIVAPNDYIFGMARMLQAQQDGLLEVFRTLEEAQEWLGISGKSISVNTAPSGYISIKSA
jgi:hypothetical protein